MRPSGYWVAFFLPCSCCFLGAAYAAANGHPVAAFWLAVLGLWLIPRR